MTSLPANSAPRRPLIIGHRGTPGYRPEHSASSYELAIALGADALEPDVVATRDRVLVLRHENEIGGTTDVEQHPEFADRRTTKLIDGHEVTGWFTEDFTWAELSTLTLRERIPDVRPDSASFDGHERMLRLAELFDIVRTGSAEQGRRIGLVIEVKHPTYFAEIGMPLDELLAAELAGSGFDSSTGLVIECFELTVLEQLKKRGVDARYVYLLEKKGAPADRVAADGKSARPFADDLTDAGLDALAKRVDGISVDKSYLLPWTKPGKAVRDLVSRAHKRGLDVFTWTLRPENVFLSKPNRRGDDRAAFGDWESEFAQIMGTGVDGVFADHTDLAVAARDALNTEG
ncbi:glycerophosphoryl diester phosphodiesterase [Paramicrobacterium humi]|uniref:glycerophosphodiester phosphodiesterase n=1 Tax=Paramicrobacterium humi TaxID=640635 RepID=A0A1H4IZ73_9MICO|nr:glycerophosphodiester phosphodiesterase family protein [Microbacterium humi]SEB38956.1 glycerophosphoryl diester phosphodiesterase [Microbacterium humi]